jgi:hypothetical protein
MPWAAARLARLYVGNISRTMSRILGTILFLVYLGVGAVIAANHHYFNHLTSAKPIISAVLAVLLWPLVLFGVNLHIK